MFYNLNLIVVRRMIILKFSFLFIFVMMLSCNDGYLGQEMQMEKLDEVGKAFMEHLLSTPNGEQHWNMLNRQGDILPNETVLSFGGGRGWHYILPLLRDNEIKGIVIFPVEGEGINESLSTGMLGSPFVLDEEEIKEDCSIQGLFRSPVIERWKKRGIIIGDKLIATQITISSLLSRSGDAGSYPALYSIVCDNYIDDDGSIVINGINEKGLQRLSEQILYLMPVTMYVNIQKDVIFVDAPSEEAALAFYQALANALEQRNCYIYYTYAWNREGGTSGGGAGGGQGGESSGSQGGGGDIPEPPIEGDPIPHEYVVSMITNCLSGKVEIGDEYNLLLSVYNTNPSAPIPVIKKVEYFVRRKGTALGGSLEEKSTGTGDDLFYTRKAISAGVLEFQAVVYIEQQVRPILSNVVTVEEMCPPITAFKDLSVVRNRAIELWNMTVDYTREHRNTRETREFGCFIYLNTGTGEYHCGETIPGDPVILDREVEGTVHFVYPDQRYDPRLSFDLIVGTLHSHYPLTWAAPGVRRAPGPSPTDNDATLPGMVYDYTKQVFAGDPIDMPKNPKEIQTY